MGAESDSGVGLGLGPFPVVITYLAPKYNFEANMSPRAFQHLLARLDAFDKMEGNSNTMLSVESNKGSLPL